MQSQKLFRIHLWTVIATGAAAFAYSAITLPLEHLDARFLMLAAFTLGVTSRVAISIPGDRATISVSDTFIFLTLLLYGGPAATVLAGTEAYLSSCLSTKNNKTRLFNAGVMSASTLLSATALRLCFGPGLGLNEGFTAASVAAVCLLAFVQYAANSFTVAVANALKHGRPIWETWRKYYLWTSLTYFAGASAAAIIARLIERVGGYAVVAATPIIIILYFTYRTYLQNVRAAAAQAEQAERHVEELNHYIAEQERIREQYAQIEKLSALGELASGVAHDFNNTLAGILGRAQLLLRTNDPEKIKRGLNIIIKSAEDGAKTVRRIQDFARQRRDHGFEALSVEQLLNDVREMTRPRWKDRAEVSGVAVSVGVRCRPELTVLGDGSELREVLVNMVFNAVDALPEGGEIVLAADEHDGNVEISISDTGVGMSEEVRSRVFDPFYTTKGKAGLGLGLAVSYGIIRRHEGSVEVESEPGRGTTFRIKLPAAPAHAAPAAPEPQPAPPPAPVRGAPGAKILVVDDEAAVRELLGDLLVSEGYEAVLASGGREALEKFDAGRFDAVFTDIGMPGMSGWELAGALRERDQVIPIAVITGWGDAVGSSERRAARVDWVVTKPFTSDRILEMAREVAKRRGDSARDEQLLVVA